MEQQEVIDQALVVNKGSGDLFAAPGEQVVPCDDGEVIGKENLLPGDMPTYPMLRVAQRSGSPFDACKPGVLGNIALEKVYDLRDARFVDGKDATSPLEVMPLAILAAGQCLWPAEYSADNVPLCWADNVYEGPPGHHNEARPMTAPREGPCVDESGRPKCPAARWPNDPLADPENNGRRPRCDRQRKFLVAVIPRDEAGNRIGFECGRLILHGMNLKFAQALTAHMVKNAGTRTLEIVSKHVSDDRGDWWELAVVPGSGGQDSGAPLSPNGIAYFQSLAKAQLRLLEEAGGDVVDLSYREEEGFSGEGPVDDMTEELDLDNIPF